MEDKHQLKEFTDRLPDRADDEVATIVIEGRALSKSDTSLHLALRTGLVAVPLDSITRVMPMPGTKELVRLVVRNPGEIRQLLRAQAGAVAQSAGGGHPRGAYIGSGYVGVATCRYYDTETATGEEGFDACDDEDSDCGADDLQE